MPTVGQLIGLLLAADTSAQAKAPQQRLLTGPAVRAFYGPAPAPAWTQAADSLSPQAVAVGSLLDDAPAYGLRPADYHQQLLRALRDSLACLPTAAGRSSRQARFEVYFSDAVLRFMLDLHRGRLRPYALSPRERRARRIFQPAPVLRRGLELGQVLPAVLASQPANREYRQLQAALARRWQLRPTPDSAATWQRQSELMALNLERWRWEAIEDSTYVLVNLPAFTLQVVENGQLLRQHRVIVGQPQTPTPTLSSVITYFTTAPDWHVPRSIATREMLPRLQADPGYLALNELTLYDQHGRTLDPYRVNWQRVTAQNFSYSIRQSAGCDNALGNVVFRFSNPYSVYLHDTPMRQFFDQPHRAFSHGCIRLDQPLQLAAYLLRREGRAVSLPSEAECARQPRPRTFRLRQPMPLYVRYATCAVESARVVCYPDVYQRDGAVRHALANPPNTLPN